MDGQYVVVSSITYAYKGKNLLEKKGIWSNIERPPKRLSSCGCHYALKIKNSSAVRAVQILESAHIRIVATGGEE